MSPVETYLLDLRTALGDRLPPALTELRLREAKSHLLASAEEVGEAEAIHRYGRPRAVATDLVRAHRGYDERNAWRLALPLLAALLANSALVTLLYALSPQGEWMVFLPAYARAFSSLVAVGFVARVVQTRRWLAGPMMAEHLLSLALVTLLRHMPGKPGGWSGDEVSFLALSVMVMSAAWLTLNALGLGIGRLLDLQRVRPARSAR